MKTQKLCIDCKWAEKFCGPKVKWWEPKESE